MPTLSAQAEITDVSAAFAYVENGEEAYVAVSESSIANQSELLADLEAISAQSLIYADKLSPANYASNTSTAMKAIALAEYYTELLAAVEAYNAKVGDIYKIAIPETFSYRAADLSVESVEADVTPVAAQLCYAQLEALAEGWENVTDYEYALKYEITDANEAALFEVYTSESGEPLVIAVGEQCEFIENKATNGVLDMVFSLEGEVYTIVVALNKNVEIDQNISAQKVYKLSVLYIYSGNSASSDATVIYNKNGNVGTQSFFATIDEDYVAYAATVSEMLADAKAYFDAPAAKTLRSEYKAYELAIQNKIEAVKIVACDTVYGLDDEMNYELYSDTVITEVEEVMATAVDAINSASAYSEVVAALEAAQQAIAEFESIPEAIMAEYGALLVPNTVYDEDDFISALVAYGAAFDPNLSQAVTEYLEEEYSFTSVLMDNIKLTAIHSIDETVAELNLDNYSDNQIREIVAQTTAAKNEISHADSLDDIEEALTDVEYFFNNGMGQFSTKTELTAAGIVITGKFDSRATVSANLGSIFGDEESYDIAEGKKQAVASRRLSALEMFDITIAVNGQPLTYAGNGEYTVKVKLTEETINIFKEGGIDPQSMLVAYVDDNGAVETYEITLSFVYNDQTTVEYTEAGSVDWDKIAEGYIMFVTKHFSSYYLMGNTSNLAMSRLTNLLSGIVDSGALTYVLYGILGLVGAILLFVLIAFICSVCTRYKIKFVTYGAKKKIRSIRRKYGKKLPKFKTPVKEGYEFAGWCIDKTCKYEFNRLVMPRSNVTLYAKWVEEGAEELSKAQAQAVVYYDKLRAALASLKKPVKSGDKSYVAQEVLAKLFADAECVKLQLKAYTNYIKDENNKAYIVTEEEMFEEYFVADEISYNKALEAIEEMAEMNGLVKVFAPELAASTYEEATAGYSYVINYENIASAEDRYAALRTLALSYEIADKSLAENGKVLFELLPNSETLELTLALDKEVYENILTEKETGGDLNLVYTIASGEDMGVAVELIDRVMEANGFDICLEAEVDEQEFNPAESYQYIIYAEAEESDVTLADLFKTYREYVMSFAMYTDESQIDRANEGLLIVRAKLNAEDIATTLDPERDAESFIFTDAEGLEQAKEKVAAVMAKYGFEHGDAYDVEDKELADSEVFGYRIKYPAAPKTTADIFNELRDYVNSYAMFIDAEAEVDTALDGTVVVTAQLQEEAVQVAVDPDAEEAQTLTVSNEAELEEAKQAIATAMAKYGMEIDPEYAPNPERAEGEGFGFRIKF